MVVTLYIYKLSLTGTKIFIREYTYQCAGIELKESARVIFLERVKRPLLEEIGVSDRSS
jgi:hypothetical protein